MLRFQLIPVKPMLSKITKNVFIGESTDIDTRDLLQEVDVIIDVRTAFYEETQMVSQDALHSVPISTWKIHWNRLRNIIQSAYSLIQDFDLLLLFHCHGGIDRSPFVVMCLLSKYFDYSPDEAYNHIKAIRPQINIHDRWLRWWKQRLEVV